MSEKPELIFNWRIGDFGLRASPKRINEKNQTIHLVKYYRTEDREFSYSIGYFWYDDHEPCWELKFVGDRFKEIPDDYIVIIFKMLGSAYDALTVWTECAKRCCDE